MDMVRRILPVAGALGVRRMGNAAESGLDGVDQR